jgi:hypothetical protein
LSSGTRVAEATAALEGSGDLSAAARRVALGSVSLSGSGTLGVEDSILVALGSAALLGGGTLAASGVLRALYRPQPSALVEVVPIAWAELDITSVPRASAGVAQDTPRALVGAVPIASGEG